MNTNSGTIWLATLVTLLATETRHWSIRGGVNALRDLIQLGCVDRVMRVSVNSNCLSAEKTLAGIDSTLYLIDEKCKDGRLSHHDVINCKQNVRGSVT